MQISFYHLLLIILAYFLGSIPFGLLISKLWGIKDIRKEGSGNIGATNVTRIAGKAAGLLTLILDGGKGAIAVLLAKFFANSQEIIYLVALSVSFGHIFPIWLKGKGGKGVATTIALLFVLNWHIALVTIGIWLLVFALFKISGLSAIITFICLPLVTYYLSPDCHLLYLMLFLSTVILVKHKNNIIKLLKK